MANGKYLYEVAVDTGSTLRAAQNVKRVRQGELSQVSAPGVGVGGAMSKPGAGLAGKLEGVNIPGMFGAIGTAGIAGLTVSAVAQQARQMAVLSSSINQADRSLVALTGSGTEAEAQQQAIQAASGGLVDRLTAMQIANKGATLGFADSSAELTRLTGLASKVSTVLGGDLRGNIDNMAAAVANLSFVRLDTLGISGYATRSASRNCAASLAIMAAFMQAMIEVGERTYRNVEQATGRGDHQRGAERPGPDHGHAHRRHR